MFLVLSHLKILRTFIFDKSILTVKLSGTDLVIFSNIPPPVIFADELIRSFFTKFKISFV